MSLLIFASIGLLFAASRVTIAANGAMAGDSADASRGRQIFVKYCSGCHGAQGQGDGYPLLGPDPANLASPATKERSDEELIRTIHEGKPNMPPWKYRLSPQDSKDVLAYIRSLSSERRK
jgi:mono/diheme cytochrome c family protein